MYHSLVFQPLGTPIFDSNGKLTGVNTYDDWFLIPEKRPHFAPPEYKSNSIDVHGVNGVIDLSQVLTGMPAYGNRTGSNTFIVENDHRSWHDTYHKIVNYLHGRKMRVFLEDDPGYYYLGRTTVSQWNSDKWWSIVTLDYDLYPFKFDSLESDEEWLWDPFSFENGIIRNYKDIDITNTSVTTTLLGSTMPVIPRFYSNDNPSKIYVKKYDLYIANTTTSAGAGFVSSEWTKINVIDAFSNYKSNKTYSINDVVLHNYILYKAKQNITTAEEWTPSHWETVYLSDIVDIFSSVSYPYGTLILHGDNSSIAERYITSENQYYVWPDMIIDDVQKVFSFADFNTSTSTKCTVSVNYRGGWL